MRTCVFSEDIPLACELIGLARSLVCECDAFMIGGAAEALVHAGADTVFALNGSSSRPEDYARPLAGLLADDTLFIVGATDAGREIAATVAGKRNWPLLPQALSVTHSSKRITIQRYAAGTDELIELETDLPCVVTVPRGVGSAMHFDIPSPVTYYPVETHSRVERLRLEKGNPGSSLENADTVIALGAGALDERIHNWCRELAERLGAELGCTRTFLERSNSLPSSSMIGITGTTVRPQLYLAVGVSGQPHHTYGMRGSHVVAAIDRNPDAPILRESDYGLVGDLLDVVPALLGEL